MSKETPIFSAAPAEQGDKKHHGHDDDVLKNQYAKAGAAVGGVDFGPFLEEFEDDGGAAQGQEETHK